MKYVFEEKANKRNALQYKTHLRLATINQSYINYSERAFASLSNLQELHLAYVSCDLQPYQHTLFRPMNFSGGNFYRQNGATYPQNKKKDSCEAQGSERDVGDFFTYPPEFPLCTLPFRLSAPAAPHASSSQVVCCNTACTILAFTLRCKIRFNWCFLWPPPPSGKIN